MAKIETLIREIDQLDYPDLEVILQVILGKINQRKRLEEILTDVTGIGKGVWQTDAQTYIDRLRDDR